MQDEMLVVEDLLLMLMDDKSGAIAGEGTLYYTLGGAVLVELALLGRVRVDEGDGGLNGLKVHAVAGEPLRDPLLREADAKVARKARGVQTLLIEIGGDLRGTVLDRLVERGLVRRESKRVLGMIPTTSLGPGDTRRKEEVLGKVRAVLLEDAEPDARTAALVALLSASGALPSLHRSLPWSDKVYKRAKQLEQGSWGADAVNTAVLRTAAGIAAASAVVVTTVLT